MPETSPTLLTSFLTGGAGEGGAQTIASLVTVVPVPHFDVPFRYQGGAPVVNEQGSDADVAACVFAVVATEPGVFLDLPDFGLPDPTFSQEPIDPATILGPISVWEPRARALLEITPSILDDAIENANIEVGTTH
jgi:hypothetical protein